jgi:uncharacterized lipoprotein YmbA
MSGTTRRGFFRAGIAATAALAGCASPNPHLYTLAAVPGTPRGGGPRLVELRDIALARYLERNPIVRSSDNYRLDVAENDWWGEPLAGMMGRVLAEELSQRLPGTTVFGESGTLSSDPDATISLNVERFDVDRTGAVLLAAQAAVRAEGSGKPVATRSLRLTAPVAGPDVGAQVAAMSAALGQLADALADMLRR